MNNTITIDGVTIELTKEQVEKLKVELGIKKKSPFERVEDGKPYFSIDWNGHTYLHSEETSRFDAERFNVANYCTDRDLMTKRTKEEALNRLLWRFSMENDGDKIDWGDDLIDKYAVYYDCHSNCYKVASYTILNIISTPYFYTYTIAQRAIDEIVIPFNEGKLPCCKIWEE